MTLYLKLGGRPTFQEAIETLERRLKQDGKFSQPHGGHVLPNADELCEFLIFLFGGAPFYDGMPIDRVLRPLRLDDTRYDRFVDHVVIALTGGRPSVRNETQLRVVMEHIRPHVVNAPGNRPGLPPQDQVGIVA